MAYIGSQPTVGLVVKLNDIASSFNSILSTFQLSIPPGGVGNNFTPGSVYQIIVSLNGVIQNPNIDYILNGSQITFTTAPAFGLTCFIIALGQSINVGTPGAGTVTTSSFGTLTSLPLTGSTSGTTTIQPPAVAGNNTLTLPTSNGSANQFLKNGATAGALAFGTTTEDASGNLAFNSGYGSAAVAYGCRAWVNFNGTANTNLSGTYSQSGTTVTVTATAHGLIAGSSINVDATSGTAVDGIYTVATVTDANTFTYTAGTSLTTSGNITLLRNTIRASGNVSSITDNGTGDYTVNFTTAMVDANYAFTVGYRGVANNDTDFTPVLHTGSSPSTTAARFVVNNMSTGSLADIDYVCISIFR